MYLNVAMRGWDAFTKVCGLLGPSDPELAKNTDPKSLRALFGVSRELNCVLPLVGVSKNAKDFAFWFAGRVNSKERVKPLDQMRKMYAVINEDVSTAVMLLSPLLERKHYQTVLSLCTKLGILLDDIRLLNMRTIKAPNDQFETTAIRLCPGYKRTAHVGLALLLRKEGLPACLSSLLARIQLRCLRGTKIEQFACVMLGKDSFKGVADEVSQSPTESCSSDGFFDTMPSETKDMSRDPQIRYIAVLVGCDGLTGQWQFTKAEELIFHKKFELDGFEVVGLAVMRREELSAAKKKPVLHMLETIRSSLKCKDFLVMILRGRNVLKKLKECYDPAKQQIITVDAKTEQRHAVGGLVISDTNSLAQVVDLYSHFKGKIYDDPFNELSCTNEAKEPYSVPMEALELSLPPCQCNRIMLDVGKNMRESLGFCLVKPYKTPTLLLTRTIKSLTNAGLRLVDVAMRELDEEQAKLIYSLEFPEDEGRRYSYYVEHVTSSHCGLLIFSGQDIIYKMFGFSRG